MPAPRVFTQRATLGLRALDTTVEIETPEHVVFSCSLAGPARRALAYLIDLLVRGAIVIAMPGNRLAWHVQPDGSLDARCGVGGLRASLRRRPVLRPLVLGTVDLSRRRRAYKKRH